MLSLAAVMVRISAVILLILMSCGGASALEPDKLLAITNRNIAESVRIAQYYCGQRGMPYRYVLALTLDANLRSKISRADYEKQLAGPIRPKFFTHKLLDKIKRLLTIRGVPIKVGR